MRRSIRTFFGWLVQGGYVRVERIAKGLGHIVVKAQSRDDGRFASDCSVRSDTGPARGQAYNVLTSEITARGNAVDYKLVAVSQVDQMRFVAALNAHRESPLGTVYDVSSVNARIAGVES